MHMNRQEATAALLAGKKVSHLYFEEHEFAKLGVGDRIEFEDGCSIDWNTFWADREGSNWDTDRSIYTGKIKVFFKGKDGEHYRLIINTDSPEMIDKILDQLNIGQVTYIHEAEFNVSDPMDIDVMDESGQVKLGTLTCKSLYTSVRG